VAAQHVHAITRGPVVVGVTPVDVARVGEVVDECRARVVRAPGAARMEVRARSVERRAHHVAVDAVALRSRAVHVFVLLARWQRRCPRAGTRHLAYHQGQDCGLDYLRHVLADVLVNEPADVVANVVVHETRPGLQQVRARLQCHKREHKQDDDTNQIEHVDGEEHATHCVGLLLLLLGRPHLQ